MNTTERIVESYFRICRHCFTSPDVKVSAGNNRQIDLLAYNLIGKQAYHVETTVTHCETWCPRLAQLEELFDYKFLGRPRKTAKQSSDYAKGKTYLKQINDTYRQFGLEPDQVQRVLCCWVLVDAADWDRFITRYCAARELPGPPIQLLSFRDEVLPSLQQGARLNTNQWRC